MDIIRRQVAQARRRLVLQQFITILPWCLFTGLVVALMGLAIPKIWVIAWDPQIWLWAWVGGASGVALLTAAIWTLATRRDTLDAAVEVDRRFGLKERVSSALMLLPDEQNSEVGQALISDTMKRVELIVVRERFQLKTTWRSLLPVVPAIAAVLLALAVPDAQQEQAQASSTTAQQRAQIKKSAQELQQKLLKKQQEAEKKGLQDAEELFRKITQGIEDLKKDDLDERKALVKLNDLAKELAQRRDSLSDPDQMKKQFDKLKELEKGPADKLAQALKEGNFEKAVEELKQLKEQLEKGELSDADKEKLAQQMEQMKQKLQEMVQAHQEAKRDLEREIQKKMAEGDMEAVNQLQKKLSQLEKADAQMERLEQMASKCEACQNAMKEGDGKKAAAELAKLQEDLDAMQAEMEQLESIQEIMDELADAKDSMRGDQEGMGDQYGMSEEMTDQFMMGPGMNEGPGGGYRPEQETATNSYDSRIRATPKAGAAVRVGDAGGPNQAGRSTEEIKVQILSSLSRDSDPMTDQRLPRSQQNHVKEYYQRLRKGE